jgi:WhiB family redox-sensing transcriptional regulator
MGGDNFIDWRTRGKCASLSPVDYDAMFFPESGRSICKARKFCNTCPVIAQCLEAALANDDQGIWAGTNYEERQSILRFREQLRAPTAVETITSIDVGVVTPTRRKIVRRSNITFV